MLNSFKSAIPDIVKPENIHYLRSSRNILSSIREQIVSPERPSIILSHDRKSILVGVDPRLLKNMLSHCVTLDVNLRFVNLFERFPNGQYTENDLGNVRIFQKTSSDKNPQTLSMSQWLSSIHYDGFNQKELSLLEPDTRYNINIDQEPNSGFINTSFLSLDEYKDFSFRFIPGKVFLGYYPDGCILHGIYPKPQIKSFSINLTTDRHSSLEFSIQISSKPGTAHSMSKSHTA